MPKEHLTQRKTGQQGRAAAGYPSKSGMKLNAVPIAQLSAEDEAQMKTSEQKDQKGQSAFIANVNPVVQRLAAEAEFETKHIAADLDAAKLKTASRTGMLGKEKVNSIMNFGDSDTKKNFEDDPTESGPAAIAAKGWVIKAATRKKPANGNRTIESATPKAAKFKVTVSGKKANHSDGWDA